MLNRVVLIGRLTKDPELRYTQNGVAVGNFTLAVDRNYKNAQGERETDFIPCVVYRQLAELVTNYLSKGKLAAVDGRIQIRSYTGQDGQKRWVTEVIAEDVRFLSPKEGGASSEISSGTSNYGQTGSGNRQSAGYGKSGGNYGQAGGLNDDNGSRGGYGQEVGLDDDIPF